MKSKNHRNYIFQTLLAAAIWFKILLMKGFFFKMWKAVTERSRATAVTVPGMRISAEGRQEGAQLAPRCPPVTSYLDTLGSWDHRQLFMILSFLDRRKVSGPLPFHFPKSFKLSNSLPIWNT